MRKVLIALFAVALIGGGSALAQDMMGTHYWAGFSAGYPGASVHFGVSEVAPSLDVRANLGFAYFGSAVTVGVDAMYHLPVDTGDLPIVVYVGGGPDVAIGFGGGFGVGVNVFAGGEYMLSQVGMDNGGVFMEVGPAVSVVPAFGAGFVGRVGFNYHF